MINRAHRFCAVMGPLAAIFFLLMLWPMAGFFPPTDPSLDADAILALYQSNTVGIRLGAVTVLFCLTAFTTFYIGITSQMLRMQGPFARTWALVQAGIGLMSLIPLYGTSISWAVAAYRLDRAPEITQALNDFGWMCLVMPVTPALVQMMAIGFGTLSDKSAEPVYPRWYGYAAFWVGVLLMTGLGVPFFKDGPFAWNGVIAFWMPAIVLGTFLNVTAVLMYKAAPRLGADRMA